MAAAASGAQAVLCTEGNMLVQLLESQRFESVNLLAAETEEGQTDISGWVLRNAKMSTLTASGWFDTTTGWLTDAEGGNFRIYAMPSPADADVDRGECPCPNAVERWNGNGHHWPENTNIIYQTANVPNGTYAVTMWAESQALADHTHKGGMFLFANEVQAEITNNCVMQQYALTVEVTDGTLTVGVKTGAGGSDDNHVVLSAVAVMADNALLEGISSENPFDATGAVANASCTEGYGWTKGAGNASASYNVNNGELDSDDYSGAGVEFWTDGSHVAKNMDVIYQEVNGLPNGSYRVTAVAMGRFQQAQGGDDNCAGGLYLFANEGQAEVTTNVWGTVTATGLVSDGTLRIGLRAGADNGNNWVALSQVKVEFIGEDMSALAEALEAKVAEAHALAESLEEGQIPTTYLTQLGGVTAPACSTAEEYNAAIAEIDALIAAANAARTTFASSFLSAKDYAEKVLAAFPGADESAKAALESALETATAAALASTDAAVWTAQGEALRAAAQTYFEASDKVMAEGLSDFDVTQLFVVNPGFDDGVNGWNTGGAEFDANLLASGGIVSVGVNQWSHGKTFDFTQTLTGLPVGVYCLSAQVSSSTGNSEVLHLTGSMEDSRVGFGNSGLSAAAAAEAWAADKEANRVSTGNVLVLDGTVTIGLNRHNGRNGEVFFDNFRLTFVSDGLAEIKSLYDALKAEAEGIDQTQLPPALAGALADALELPVATTAEYYAAYDALLAVMEDCRAVQDVAASLPGLIEECRAYLDNSTGGGDARGALEEAVEAAEGYMDLSGAEEIVACADGLEAARRAFAEAATPTGDQQFDMNYLLTNACTTGEATGWYGDAAGGVGVSASASYIGDLGFSHFIEKWSASALKPAEDGNGWLIYQQAVLPAGAYTLTAAAFTDMPYNADETVTGHASACLAMGFGSIAMVEGDAIVWTEHEKYPGEVPAEENQNKLEYLSIPSFYLGEAATAENPVKLGIYIKADNEADWFGINDMKLYKVAPAATAVALDETETYGVTADTYADVTLRRTLETGCWNTFCVPFDMTPEQLADNGISEVRTFSGVMAQGGNLTLQTTVVRDGVKAGVPYIVKVDREVLEITANGVNVVASAPAAHRIGFSGTAFVEMTGNYSAGTVPAGAYFMTNDVFTLAGAAVAQNGFRAYVTLVDDAGNPAQSDVSRILIDIDGKVTAIDEVLAADADKLVDVYTLGGVLVKRGVKKSEALDGLQRGAYIVDGETYLK